MLKAANVKLKWIENESHSIPAVNRVFSDWVRMMTPNILSFSLFLSVNYIQSERLYMAAGKRGKRKWAARQ